MPCYSHSDQEMTMSDLRMEIDDLTRMLCEVITTLDDCGYLITKKLLLRQVKGLNSWWEAHQQLDEERRRKEEREQAQKNREERRAFIKIAHKFGIDGRKLLREQKYKKKYYEPEMDEKVMADIDGERYKVIVRDIIPSKGIYPNDICYSVEFRGGHKRRIFRDANIQPIKFGR